MINLPKVWKKIAKWCNGAMVKVKKCGVASCRGIETSLLGVASSLRRVKSKRPRLQGKETHTENYHFLHVFFPVRLRL